MIEYMSQLSAQVDDTMKRITRLKDHRRMYGQGTAYYMEVTASIEMLETRLKSIMSEYMEVS